VQRRLHIEAPFVYHLLAGDVEDDPRELEDLLLVRILHLGARRHLPLTPATPAPRVSAKKT
jgi:hypothetical protein